VFKGVIGAFRGDRPVQVPLWLAVLLKTRHKCRIQPPEWLNKGLHSLAFFVPNMPLEYLVESLALERDSEVSFTEMPRHFIEISSILLRVFVTLMSILLRVLVTLMSILLRVLVTLISIVCRSR
jgi:GINS complex subunit 2